MIRMGNIYLSEGEFENAYILFIKFMTLFIEKVKTHPGFKDPAINEMKKANKEKLMEGERWEMSKRKGCNDLE